MLRSWGEFNGPLREALHRLKYKNDIALGATFAKPLIELANNNDWDFDIVIPIPISKRHKKDRGYNQAALIAFPIALAFKKPFTQSAVLRIKETKSQVKLSSVERFKNLQNAFQGNSAKLKDKKVLLVDDVTTTGATIDSCAQTLIESGCKKVYCLTVAQTPKIYQKTL